jgi:two-component system, LytTR family, sensor kinase
MAKPLPPQSDTWSGKQLIISIGILYAFIQLTTLTRVYALNYLDNLNSPSSEMIRDRLIGTLIGLTFIIAIITLTRYLLQRDWSAYRVILVHVLLILPVTFVWYFIFSQVALWFCQIFQDCAQVDDDPIYGYLLNANILTLVYLLAVAVTHTYYYVRRDNEHQLRQSQMETKILQARMKMLRSQLHPHFLFNTLNSVNSLMDIDVDKAKVMVVDLADLLRKVLDWKDAQKVPLKDELALLRRYVDIEKMRFSEDLTVSWSVAEAVLEAKVPGMLLQPLVENAIHHGFSPAHLHLDILISVGQTAAGQLQLRVSDNGQGFPRAEQDRIFELGTGLQNTRERLQTLYGEAFSFEVRNTYPGVVSEITLPLNQE